MAAHGDHDAREPLSSDDIERPSPARIYDYLLGGYHNFAADRAVGDRVIAALPELRPAVWANRAFLRRGVAYLATRCRMRQFLDLGAGIPTVGNVHDIAQAANPESCVAYVDNDPVAVAQARQSLANNPRADGIRADLREPDQVLDHPRVRALLDLSQPVAVLMVAVLHFVPDQERPADIIAGYARRLAPGSYLLFSHGTPTPAMREQELLAAREYEQTTGQSFAPRPAERMLSWFDGFELEAPGFIPVSDWHPDVDTIATTSVYGGLGRKPAAS